MASPPELKGIRKDEIPEAPAWLEKLLRPLNLFLQQVGQALAGNLTVKENLAGRWVDVEVTQGVATKPFAVGLGTRPAKGVFLARVATPSDQPPEAAVVIEWRASSVRQPGGATVPAIEITNFSGLGTGNTATLTLLVLAE